MHSYGSGAVKNDKKQNKTEVRTVITKNVVPRYGTGSRYCNGTSSK
jgi:hypothetical protein